MALPELTTWLLCLFAAVLLAARPLPPGRGTWVVPAAFLVAAPLGLRVSLTSAALALLAGGAVALYLLRKHKPTPLLAHGLAGGCAGLAAASLFPPAQFGAGGWVALACALALPWASARKSGEPAFAPPVVRDEAGCAVVIAAPLVAALPAAQEGWHSALVLAGSQGHPDAVALGHWFILPVLAFVVGVARQMWVRR